eukprot:7329296-Pyramimonas_sp.AAC.1
MRPLRCSGTPLRGPRATQRNAFIWRQGNAMPCSAQPRQSIARGNATPRNGMFMDSLHRRIL